MKTYEVRGGEGVRLHVREWGRSNGRPILFIHGWSQNHLCWKKQYKSTLADEFRLVAFDLRGHGMSEAPPAPEQYNNAQLWADDIEAIIRELAIDTPVIVGWSYGGFIVCDYVRAYGEDHISAINLVGGGVSMSQAAFGTLIGPGFVEHFAGATAQDLPTNIQTFRKFLRVCAVRPLSPDDLEEALCFNIVVSPAIRAAMAMRETNSDDVLSRLRIPMLVTHGNADIVVLPAMAEHIAATCPTAKLSWYEGVGHLPHMEESERFNKELADLTRGTMFQRAQTA